MFDGFIGQKNAKERLARRARLGAGCRAFLLTGERGLGKRAFAVEFAKALLCKNSGSGAGASPRGGSDAPCGLCAPCKMFDAGSSDDFLLVDPPSEKAVSVDEIRGVSDWIAIRPMYARAKVCVVADADRMTKQAQNALLKTLEEPPDYALIALTASRADALLDTVRSRCETVSFTRYSAAEVESILTERGIAADAAALAARISGGAPGLVGWGETISEFMESRDWVFGILAKMAAGDLRAPVELAERLEKGKDVFLEETELMTAILRDAWLVAARVEAGLSCGAPGETGLRGSSDGAPFYASNGAPGGAPGGASGGASGGPSGASGTLLNADLADGLESVAAGSNARTILRCVGEIAAIRDSVSKNANLPLAADALVTRLSKLSDTYNTNSAYK